ncbi:hypothetical protein [Streptomyces sp. FH025]|uniref:hypothetical protein n=1 Tax=Streptomyces sp. FH025 TaxID=2815937 RepID=UPI001A9DEFA2|nr:hypothetical protein [Streptomyces sp. FH025]MBO1414660.1 hypothetical protein [Streptomyces sp. FH025]
MAVGRGLVAVLDRADTTEGFKIPSKELKNSLGRSSRRSRRSRRDDRLRADMATLDGLGAGLAIDDFGTGGEHRPSPGTLDVR